MLPVKWLQCESWPHCGAPDSGGFSLGGTRKYCTQVLRLFQNITVGGAEQEKKNINVCVKPSVDGLHVKEGSC